MDANHEAEELRREMARLRGGLHGEVEGIVAGTRTMTDYRYYLGRYPWACAGAAVVVGYLVVPNKTRIISPSVRELEKLAKRNELLIKAKPDVSQKQAGPMNALIKLAANALVRAGIAYMGQQAGKVITESQMKDSDEPARARAR